MIYDTLLINGNGIDGIYLLGSLQKITDIYLLSNISVYIGISSGSITLFLLAIGYTPIEIIVYLVANSLFDEKKDLDVISMFSGKGIMSFDFIKLYLEKMTISKIGYLPTLLDIKNKFGKKFIVSVYNLDTLESEYLDYENNPELDCIKAISMSCAVPFVFQEQIYKNNRYIDGAIADNLPIKLAQTHGTYILILKLSYKNTKICHIHENPLKYLHEILKISINNFINDKIIDFEKIKIIDVHIQNEFFTLSTVLSSKNLLDMFSFGYQYVTNLYSQTI